MKKIIQTFIGAASLLLLAALGCATTPGPGTTSPLSYALTVNSVNPASGVSIKVSPADLNSAGTAGAQAPQTDLSLIYNPGTAVTLTAPASTGSGAFVAWAGCDSTAGFVCTVSLDKSKSVQVEYTGVSSITIVPNTITVPRGGGVQVPAVVNGFGTCTVAPNPPQPCAGSSLTYSLYFPAGVTGALGTISSTGYYTPDSSNPATSVNVTAASALAPNVTATAVIALQ
jgi:hypothetical protein